MLARRFRYKSHFQSHSHSGSQFFECVQRRIPCTNLKSADIRLANPGCLGKLCPGKVMFPPELGNCMHNLALRLNSGPFSCKFRVLKPFIQCITKILPHDPNVSCQMSPLCCFSSIQQFILCHPHRCLRHSYHLYRPRHHLPCRHHLNCPARENHRYGISRNPGH